MRRNVPCAPEMNFRQFLSPNIDTDDRQSTDPAGFFTTENGRVAFSFVRRSSRPAPINCASFPPCANAAGERGNLPSGARRSMLDRRRHSPANHPRRALAGVQARVARRRFSRKPVPIDRAPLRARTHDTALAIIDWLDFLLVLICPRLTYLKLGFERSQTNAPPSIV
jgi:hypothetical protein